MAEISWQDFEKVEMRVGTITKTEEFPEARVPAYKVWVDLGELGERKSSAQLTEVYSKDELVGKQVICVVNFAPKQVGPFMSECLVTGIVGDEQGTVLLLPERKVKNGLRVA